LSVDGQRRVDWKAVHTVSRFSFAQNPINFCTQPLRRASIAYGIIIMARKAFPKKLFCIA
jgi:hypothetical protein